MMKFKPMELNSENIDFIFEYCLANEYDEHADIYTSSIFMDETKNNEVQFSKRRLEKCRKSLMYMIGQLKVIHDDRALKMYAAADLNLTYRGMNWSESKLRFFAFPHLTRYFGWCAPFIEIEGDLYLHSIKNDFSSTLSPNDPMFEEWWKKHRKDWED